MAQRMCLPLFLIALVYSGSRATYVEAVAGAFDLSKGHPAPRIAQYCGSVSMHIDLVTGDWVADSDRYADCQDKNTEILDYCKKMYPELEITNVVEANEDETIAQWCKIGGTKCKHSHKVTPFRCIVGKFESDALMVPNKCKFAHIHDSSVCLSHDKWQFEAKESCTTRGMELHDYGMLLPCDIDVFSGVEFVCCPIDESAEKQETEEIVEAEPLVIEGIDLKEDEDDRFFTMEGGNPNEEHNEFEMARERLEQHHRERMSKVMKQWEAAEANYEELKKTDAVTAEKERKGMMERFQTTVMSLEQEAENLREQLRDTHLQHIEKNINEKKRVALEAYTKALQAINPKSKDLLHGLQKFIHAEQKDRQHSLHHYEHTRQTNPKKAEDMKPALLEHIREVDDRINQSIEMLKVQLPDIYSILKDKINEIVDMYDSEFADSSLVLRPAPVEIVTETDTKTTVVTEPPKYEESQESEEIEPETIIDYWDETGDDSDIDDSESDNESEIVEEEMDEEVMEMLMTTIAPDLTTYDEETMEDESILPVQQKLMASKFDASKDSKFKVQESFNKPFVVKKKMTYPHKSFLALGLVGGAVAVATVVIIALVIVRKKTQRVPVNNGFIEVDPKMTMEQRHITMMQHNGYENPTYKYFEMQ